MHSFLRFQSVQCVRNQKHLSNAHFFCDVKSRPSLSLFTIIKSFLFQLINFFSHVINRKKKYTSFKRPRYEQGTLVLQRARVGGMVRSACLALCVTDKNLGVSTLNLDKSIAISINKLLGFFFFFLLGLTIWSIFAFWLFLSCF